MMEKTQKERKGERERDRRRIIFNRSSNLMQSKLSKLSSTGAFKAPAAQEKIFQRLGYFYYFRWIYKKMCCWLFYPYITTRSCALSKPDLDSIF